MKVWIALLRGVKVGHDNKRRMTGRNLQSCHEIFERALAL